jgi:putative sporulation protein YyaC
MQEIVILCIGSDMVSGDSLGPCVGSKLIEKFNINTYIYGKIGRSVNALNIEKYLDFLSRFHKDAILIAIDACLSNKSSDVGKIKISYKGIAAGLAVDKNFANRIGDIGIIGIVGLAGTNNVDELLSVPFEKVDNLADNIAVKVNNLVNNRYCIE